MLVPRSFAGAFGLLLLAVPGFPAEKVTDPFPPKAAVSYLVSVNGATLWAREPDKPLPQASLTKIMTALLVLERTRPDEIVTVSESARRETGSRIGLAAGDRMTAGDLLAAALLPSANDACRALADHVAGNETRFVALMNERARLMKLDGTRFVNACGLDARGHHATARDLARLTAAALDNPAFAEEVSLGRKTVRTAGGARTFRLENANELIGRYRGAIGVKSGFTSGAGKCVIVLAERGATRVLLVLLNAPDRWSTAEEMLDRAFAWAARAGSASL